jgi:hypothetical protein
MSASRTIREAERHSDVGRESETGIGGKGDLVNRSGVGGPIGAGEFGSAMLKING